MIATFILLLVTLSACARKPMLVALPLLANPEIVSADSALVNMQWRQIQVNATDGSNTALKKENQSQPKPNLMQFIKDKLFS